MHQKTRSPCSKCGRLNRYQRRGLCRRCHEDPAIRAVYTKRWAKAAKANGADVAESLDPGPTRAAPGSTEKQLIMRARVMHGFDVTSELDNCA
jgi:hypothetical protein